MDNIDYIKLIIEKLDTISDIKTLQDILKILNAASLVSGKKYNAAVTKKFAGEILNISEIKPKALENYLKEGADPNVNTADYPYYSMNAIFIAIELGTLKQVNILLVYGADPNIKINEKTRLGGFEKGETPLMYAIKIYYPLKNFRYPVEVVKMLIEFGADPYLKNNNGDDAFDVLEKYYGEHGRKKNEKGANTEDIDNTYREIYDILDMGHGKNIKG